MFMTSREFNQQVNKAQKAAQIAPVIITNRGKPAFVLMTYDEFEKRDPAPKKSLIELLGDADPACADIEFDIPPRSPAQRRPVEF